MFERQSFRSLDRETARNVIPTTPPVWPAPALNGRAPVVIPSSAKSPGVDLAYLREQPSDLLATYPVGSPNGSESYFMPSMMPAFAVRDGVITYAAEQAHGHAVVVDHRNGWATYYTNLEHMFATPTSRRRSREARVNAGDVLGFIGSSTPGAFKCLHFELWKRDEESHFVSIDPSDEMRSWAVLPLTDERLTPTASALDQLAA